MSTQRIAVAVLGTGRVAELAVRRIRKRADLTLAGIVAAVEPPPAGSDCVVYLPTSTELAAGTAAARVTELLRAGFDVVTTAPVAAPGDAGLIAACRAGASTFHATGGFQASLVTRFNRAFASITRNIRAVALTEELDVEDEPAHPWAVADDAGFAESDPQALNARALAVEAYYDAGLRTLSEAVFGDGQNAGDITAVAARHRRDGGTRRERQADVDQVVVRRSLGAHVAYDSVWTRRQGAEAPLRYRLSTRTDDAVGNVTVTFHAEGEVHPADHLACAGLLDAIRPVHESAPGILHHDLDIHHVKPDDRLAR